MPPRPDLPPVVGYSEGTVIVAEGARVMVRTCDWCGAAIMLDPRDGHDRLKAHTDWHVGLRRGWPR